MSVYETLGGPLEAVDRQASGEGVVVARGCRHRPETGNDLPLAEDPPEHPVQRRRVDGFDQLRISLIVTARFA